MSTLEDVESSKMNDGDWSGRAEQLLQKQLKNVQEECRQLRDAYRREGSSSRLSRYSRTNSTQSLIQTSPPSLSHTTPHHHITSSLNTTNYSTTSLTNSFKSELATPSMTSSRHHQPHPTQTEKSSKKKTSSSIKKKSLAKTNTITPSSYNTTNIHSHDNIRKRQFNTPLAQFDSGYSGSGSSGVRGNGQLAFHVKSDVKPSADWNGIKTSHRNPFHTSPSLPQPPSSGGSLTIPATVHVTSTTRSDIVERDSERKKRDEGKIRQLQHEVTVLEKQLAEKTQAARSHVEEVTCMRSELARERAALARERQESRETASVQLRKEKASHVEQYQQLTKQLEKLRADKRECDREIGILRASMKGNEGEVKRLSETISRLTQQLELERENYASTTKSLHSVTEESRTKVAKLEEALQSCHNEVSSHMTQLIDLDRTHHQQVESLNKKIASLEVMGSNLKSQLQDRESVVSQLQSQIVKNEMKYKTELQDKIDNIAHIQNTLTRLEVDKELEKEGERRRVSELQSSLDQSESVRQSLLEQVDRNRHELEKMTEKLATVQDRESEIEQYRSELNQLRHMVTELQSERRERDRESREWHEEQNRLQIQLGQHEAQIHSMSTQLQQARDRETEYSRATAELIKEAGQVRAESGRLKGQLEASEKELSEMRNEFKKKQESEQNNTNTLSQELALRAKQVLEMEQLLRRQQVESSTRKVELERKLSQSQSELRTRTDQLQQLTIQLKQSQMVADGLQGKVSQLQTAQQNNTSDTIKKLSSKENELALLRHRLQALEESHTTILTSSEQLNVTHRKAEAQIAEQLKIRQEELSRTRAQVSSLTIELNSEKKTTDELRNQLTLARAEATRYQTQVSSMQRAVSLSNIGLSHSTTTSTSKPRTIATPTHVASKQLDDKTTSTASQMKGNVIDL